MKETQKTFKRGGRSRRMRPYLLVVLFVLPSVAAEFGEEVNGWPVGEGGFSHDPAIRFSPEALAAIQARAMAETDPTIWERLHDAPLGPLNQVGPATLYPYYPMVVAELQRLETLHPDLIRVDSVGGSELGLNLMMAEIGNFGDEDEADFVGWDDREVIWIDGGTHSNEYSGVYFVLAVAQYLVESYGTDEFATWVVDNRHTWIMPMVNPDGSHAMGRMNANGVNINRNYPVIWGGEGTDLLLNNPGPSPASEKETQVNIEWFNITRPDYYASIHCCGNLWLFPYGEDGYDPADVDMMNRVCDEAFPPEIRSSCGPIWSTIYPASGSSVDTAYEYTGAVSFGFEMSGRSNLAGQWGEPVTFAEVFAQEAESWQGIRHAFEHVERYGAYLVVEQIQADDAGLFITVRNEGMGNLTAGTLTYQGVDLLDVVRFGEATVPALAANESATVYVNGATSEGDHWFEMIYPKRIWEASNERTEVVPVRAGMAQEVAAVDGGWLVPTNPEAADPDVVGKVDVPGLPLAWVGALVAGAALRQRKQGR